MKKEKQLWFKAKLYGWGWYPATWEGWAVTLGFVVAALGISQVYNPKIEANVPYFFGGLVLAVIALLFICYKTGEPPRWRWGK